MTQPANTRVRVEHGGADTNEFWDVGLTPLQLSFAGVETDMTGFSVQLDLETGLLSLNAGYAPGSPQRRDEDAMFADFGDSATQALLEHVTGRTGDYGRFVETATADTADRLHRLQMLSIGLDEREEMLAD